MKETKLSEASVYELCEELRSRDEVVAVTVWQTEDLMEALKVNSYKPTEERVEKLAEESCKALENCETGWSILDSCIWMCDFGDSDL